MCGFNLCLHVESLNKTILSNTFDRINISLWSIYNEFTHLLIFYSNTLNSLFDGKQWKLICIKVMANLKKEWQKGVQVPFIRSSLLASFIDT